MWLDTLILCAPLVVAALGMAGARWETHRWEARTRAASRPVNVRPFPQNRATLYPPLDAGHGRAARRARSKGQQ